MAAANRAAAFSTQATVNALFMTVSLERVVPFGCPQGAARPPAAEISPLYRIDAPALFGARELRRRRNEPVTAGVVAITLAPCTPFSTARSPAARPGPAPTWLTATTG